MSRPQPPTPAEYDDMLARLVDRGMTHAQIAGLTDRQVHAHCFPPRDEKGNIEPPAPAEEVSCVPEDLPQIEQDRIALFVLGKSLGVPYGKLREAWAGRYPDVPPPPPED